MAAALVGPIVNALMPYLTQEVRYVLDVERELSKLNETLSTILAVLEDAERRQFKDKAVGDWLHKLKDAAYDAQAIVDDCEINGLRVGREMSGAVGVCGKFLNSFRFLHVKGRRKMGRKIKRFRERLDEIDADKRQFQLSAGAIVPGGLGENDCRAPSISLSEPKVYGREGDVDNIVRLLSHVDDGIVAIPVLGMGGLGKTTLVQLVYNDARVKTRFAIRIWVCVSVEFKLERLVRAIIESATGKVCGLIELDPLQRSLRETLEGTQFLLVLDDVWHDQESVWEPLKQILMCGAQGSAVIVTTRMEKVALMMGSIEAPYRLGLLDDVSCLALFEWKAFGGGRREKKQSLVQIGEEIVCKCKGVPLAAKALGSLLFFKNEEREWLLIRDSEIWELPQDENNILPILRLSYDHMPSQLKQCFAFCSIFPKDTVIEKKKLTRIWVANGFICSRGNMELEDVGHEIFDELIWRTMFQDVKLDEFGNTLSCKMHDLMHDLAQSVMLYECMIMVDGRRQHCTSNRTRHLQFCDYKSMSTTDHVNAKKVRTIMFNSTDRGRPRIEGVIKYVKVFKQLRVLDLKNAAEENLHPTIGKLKHLRYLDISGWLVKALPDSITNLKFLQSLILKNCNKLHHLPKGLPNMRSLHHLDVSGCASLLSLPSKIGKLCLLQTLPIYILGENGELGLDQLQNLILRGELAVKHLERVFSGSFNSGTKFIRGQILDTLKLSWKRISSTSRGDHDQANSDREILETLQPHSCLKKLEIDGYGGSTFPSWLMQTSMLSCLVSVFLKNCFRCQILPPLGQLPSLKQLDILKMDAVKCIGSEFYGDLHTSFPSLEKLIIGSMPNLEMWSVGEHIGALLNQLLRLTLIMLPVLEKFPSGLLRNCCNLQFLVLQSCSFNTLEAELDSLVMMKRLQINECNELSSLPGGLRNLSALEELEIVKCNKLKSLASRDVLFGLVSLRTLSIKQCNFLTSLTDDISPLLALNHLGIWDCNNLVALPQGVESLSSLKSLSIIGCEKVSSLPEVVTTLESLHVSCKLILAASTDWVQRLTSLTGLFLYECGSVLQSLPPWLMQLTALNRLHIRGASPELVARCEVNGEDRHKIAHLPEQNVCIFSS